MRTIVLFVCAVAALSPAMAQNQQLIPTPYPSGGEGARIHNQQNVVRHQRLVPTPYPRTLGPNALGNPRITTGKRHRQKLQRTPYPRQFR